MAENIKHPLLKKLRVKPGFRVSLWHAPDDFSSLFAPLPSDVSFSFDKAHTADAFFVFLTSKLELANVLPFLKQHIGADTLCWIFYPKAQSVLAGDLNMMSSWDDLKAFQLTPCASVALNATWTGLRIKPEAEQKKSGYGNAEIAKSALAQYIDVSNKTVRLPPDVEAVLQAYPTAKAFFDSLSYSNRKEYILWVITAKQEKTRMMRLKKMLEKLRANKKNPSAL